MVKNSNLEVPRRFTKEEKKLIAVILRIVTIIT